VTVRFHGAQSVRSPARAPETYPRGVASASGGNA
jgi:hypothetical protein